MLEYTLTDKNGDFIFAAKKQEKPVFLKVTYMGFETHKEVVQEINSNKDFKIIDVINDFVVYSTEHNTRKTDGKDIENMPYVQSSKSTYFRNG